MRAAVVIVAGLAIFAEIARAVRDVAGRCRP